MAYNKDNTTYGLFIPTIWNEGFERELEKKLILAENTTRKYEGAVKKQGDQVKILGTNRVTIRTLARENASGDITGPEEVGGNFQMLYVQQIRYFNYKIGDLDKAQSVNGLMEEHNNSATYGMADEIDKYIASVHVVDANNPNRVSTELANIHVVNKVAGVATKDSVLQALRDAKKQLGKQNVPASAKVTATVSLDTAYLIREALIALDTNNSERIAKGVIGTYYGIEIKESNNVYTPTVQYAVGNDTYERVEEHIHIKTDDAVAYVYGLTHHEPYRPEKSFADAVKGFSLFDAKVVRPKEIAVIKLIHAAGTKVTTP